MQMRARGLARKNIFYRVSYINLNLYSRFRRFRRADNATSFAVVWQNVKRQIVDDLSTMRHDKIG